MLRVAVPAARSTATISAGLGYVYDCDSPFFEYLAEHPRNLLNPGEIRQSRPAYLLLGWALLPFIGLAAWVLPLGDDHAFYALEALGSAPSSLPSSFSCAICCGSGPGRRSPPP